MWPRPGLLSRLPSGQWQPTVLGPNAHSHPTGCSESLPSRSKERMGVQLHLCPKSRFWTGWMCQRWPSAPEMKQWCFLRATVEPCGLDKQSQISGSVSLFLTIKRILLHHVSHITPGNPLYLCFSCLPLYLILDSILILLCANIVGQHKDCLLYHKIFCIFDCMRIICLMSTGKTPKHYLAWKITKYSISMLIPKSFSNIKKNYRFQHI